MTTRNIGDLWPAEVLALNALAFDLGLNRCIEPEYLSEHMTPDNTYPSAVVLTYHDRGCRDDIAHHRVAVRLDHGVEVLIDVPAEVWERSARPQRAPVTTPLVERYAAMLRARSRRRDVKVPG